MKSITRKVLEDFNDNNINYCVLRNYDDPEFLTVTDVDILVSWKHGFKVKRILKKHGLTKTFLGLHIKSIRFFDIKMGCLEHNGYYIKSGEEVLKHRRRHNYFYILSAEDEFMHIMLKFLYNDKYKHFIENISIDIIKVYIIIYNIFGSAGVNYACDVYSKDYSKFNTHRKKLLKQINSYRNKLLYYIYRLTFPCLKR
jgi:hypothetical protein